MTKLDVSEVVVSLASASVSFGGLGCRTEVLESVMVVSSPAKIHGMSIWLGDRGFFIMLDELLRVFRKACTY